MHVVVACFCDVFGCGMGAFRALGVVDIEQVHSYFNCVVRPLRSGVRRLFALLLGLACLLCEWERKRETMNKEKTKMWANSAEIASIWPKLAGVAPNVGPERSLILDLQWAHREVNCKADALSNLCFDRFNPGNRAGGHGQ